MSLQPRSAQVRLTDDVHVFAQSSIQTAPSYPGHEPLDIAASHERLVASRSCGTQHAPVCGAAHAGCFWHVDSSIGLPPPGQVSPVISPHFFVVALQQYFFSGWVQRSGVHALSLRGLRPALLHSVGVFSVQIWPSQHAFFCSATGGSPHGLVDAAGHDAGLPASGVSPLGHVVPLRMAHVLSLVAQHATVFGLQVPPLHW